MRMIAALLAILLLAACTDKDRLPSGILEKEKMEKVLWDMMEADQYASIYLVKDTARLTRDTVLLAKDSSRLAKDTARINLKMETLRLYQEIFRLHQVTREEFSRSFAYYRDRPDLTRGLFDSLLAKGNRLRTESYSSPHPTPTPPPVMPTTVNPAKGLIPGPATHNRPPNTPGFPHGFPPLKPNVRAPYPSGKPANKSPARIPAGDTTKHGRGFLRPQPAIRKP